MRSTRTIITSTCRALLVLAAALMGSCAPADETGLAEPTRDEIYLVDSYVRILDAQQEIGVTALNSESLFARLDSTIDTTRIANTIETLNEDPERWLMVFEMIEQRLDASSQGQD